MYRKLTWVPSVLLMFFCCCLLSPYPEQLVWNWGPKLEDPGPEWERLFRASNPDQSLSWANPPSLSTSGHSDLEGNNLPAKNLFHPTDRPDLSVHWAQGQLRKPQGLARRT
jgi:hypothetical protein